MKAYFYGLFNGRINRRTFVFGIFINLIIVFLIVFILSKRFIEQILQRYPVVYFVYLLLLIIPILFTTSLSWRRLNDVNEDKIKERNLKKTNLDNIVKEGTWDYFGFFMKGEDRENKYGKPPAPEVDIKGLFGF